MRRAGRRAARPTSLRRIHGFELTPEDALLLRADPPERALRWAARGVGANARVVRITALEGGTSSAVHALDVQDADGRVRPFVLRRFVREEWLAEEPDAPLREAAALDAVRACPLPTPELIALDAEGDRAGEPALLMTRLEGELVLRPRARDLDDWLHDLAAALPQLHATAIPPNADALGDYDHWGLRIDRPPPQARQPAAVWERAFAAFDHAPASRSRERRLLHRDYHPGNVLWRRGEISGIVDWASASVGPSDADVGHCRKDIATLVDLDAADRFLAFHRELTGAGAYDPYWDVVAALGGFEQDDLAGWTPREEAFLARAAERFEP